MVLTKNPTEFVERSLELLQARPTSTRITSTYHVAAPPPPSSTSTSTSTTRRKQLKKAPLPPLPPSSHDQSSTTAETKPKLPRGTLTLKTYDPISGVTIKFRTDKIADVGRLVGGLHRIGRGMCGLDDSASTAPTDGNSGEVPDVSITGGSIAGATVGGGDVSVATSAAAGGETSTGGGGGGKNKKKKKGKK